MSGCISTNSIPVEWDYKRVKLIPKGFKIIVRNVTDIASEITKYQNEFLVENGKKWWELIFIQDTHFIFKRPIIQ